METNCIVESCVPREKTITAYSYRDTDNADHPGREPFSEGWWDCRLL